MRHLWIGGVWRLWAHCCGICHQLECKILTRHCGGSCTIWHGIKVSIVHRFHSHLHFWKETNDWELATCLTNGRMAWLHRLARQQTAATEGKDGSKLPPIAWVTEQAHSTEEPQSTPKEGGGTTSCELTWRWVKGKATAYSNQLSALICYLTKVEVQHAAEH